MTGVQTCALPICLEAILPDDFLSKLTPQGECLIWSGTRNNGGYGSYRRWFAHRFSYEQVYGMIPKGLQIDHLCRQRACVNPLHLEAVTCRENLLRGNTITASQVLRTHCPKNHEYTEANTYVQIGNGRSCKICRLEATRRWRRSKKLL